MNQTVKTTTRANLPWIVYKGENPGEAVFPQGSGKTETNKIKPEMHWLTNDGKKF